MYKIEISGFKTKQQAEEFVNWYEGQGEQTATEWFEARRSDQELDVDFMPVDCVKTYPLTWNENILPCHLKIS